METLEHCTVCLSDNISPLMDCADHFVTNESFSIQRCNACSFCFTSPRPEEKDVGQYYESIEYISHSKTQKGLVNRLFHLSRNYTINYKKKLVKKYSSGNSILDYGCGTGDFLHAMSSSGWDCFGIEPNKKARDIALSKGNIKAWHENMLDEIPDNSFHAITLWHVLEHIYPLNDRLRSFYRLLDEKGMLFVALPNMQSSDALRYGPYWAAWDVPRHIHHFNPETIVKLMYRYGFQLMDTRPLFLDAFYISLLSEKYKSGKSKFPIAMFHGLQSNLHAFFGNGNYSSLIYIFKKSE